LSLSGAFFLLIEKPCMRKDWLSRMRQRMCTALRLRSQPGRLTEWKSGGIASPHLLPHSN
jgi:hypothetical protein